MGTDRKIRTGILDAWPGVCTYCSKICPTLRRAKMYGRMRGVLRELPSPCGLGSSIHLIVYYESFSLIFTMCVHSCLVVSIGILVN